MYSMYVVWTSNHFLVKGEKINCSDGNQPHLLNLLKFELFFPQLTFSPLLHHTAREYQLQPFKFTGFYC